MAGVRKKANKRGGNYQGYFINHAGRREWFTGTQSRQETREMAQHLEAEHKQMRLGLKPLPASPARHRKRPFLEIVDEYIQWGRVFGRKDGKGWTPEWTDQVRKHLHKWVETLCIESLAELDGILPRVEATLQQLAAQGYHGRGRSGMAKPLKAFCNWCIGHGYLRDNPLKGLAHIDDTPETERRALTVGEIARLFSVAPHWRQLLYATAIVTGLRKSELRRLDRADLEVENARLHLRWRQTKNRKPTYRYLPINLVPKLAAFADSGAPKQLYERAKTRQALPESPLLFVPTHAVRLLYQDLQKVNIPRMTHEGKFDFHALRVSSITLAAHSGASVKDVQEHARHSDAKLTMNVYAKTTDPRMMALAEHIGTAIPVLESATEVQNSLDGPNGHERKSLPEPMLTSLQNEKGPCLYDESPTLSEGLQYMNTISPKAANSGRECSFAGGMDGQNLDTTEHSLGTSERLKCATRVLQGCNDPRLARLVERWPCLSADVQAEIMRLVR